jgi:hypothetical protein
MTPAGFKAWREQLGLSKQLAAKLLGVQTESIDHYECKLRLNGNWLAQIPNTVERSCKYLSRQRQLYRQLQMLESSAALKREVTRAGVLKNRQELTKMLRNQLSDIDKLLCSQSNLRGQR